MAATGIKVEVDASKAIARLERMTPAVRTAIRGEVVSLTQQLAAQVRANLSGAVLQKRSGRLLASIKSEMVETTTTLTGRVYSDGSVPYAMIHEFGGRTSPHVIAAKNASALAFMWKGRMAFFRQVNHPGSRIPERSYLRSALAGMRDEIVSRLTEAAKTAAREG